MENTSTQDQIAQHYLAMLDSVLLINAALDNPAAYADDETVVSRNVDHLVLMMEKDFWADEDMTSVKAVVARAKG